MQLHLRRFFMFRRSLVAIIPLVLAGFLGFTAPGTALAQQGLIAQQAFPPGLSYPISANTAQGVFNGTLRIVAFGVNNGALVASGIVSGTVVGATGVSTVSQMVTIPVNMGAKAATVGTVAAPAAAACGILNLVLGPLHLDLLGLVVDLNQVVLNLNAVPGAGNLLGNLLCAVTNLLNSGGSLTQIANLLNQILALL
jgi:hypothetical protein